jgi:hypothetical protein
MAELARLVGVYDADHTIRGELAYFVGARLGRAHCSLCDITHGLLREKGDWQQCRADLPIPFDTFHRDDQPDEVRRATGGAAPLVVAELDDGSIDVLLDGEQLEACDGSVERLQSAVEAAVAAHELTWPR